MKNLLKALVDAKLIASADVSEELAVAQLGSALVAQTATNKEQADEIVALKAKVQEADTKAAATLATEADAAVAACVKAGKIKDDKDLRAKWVSAYVKDATSTKAMLDNLPEAKAPRGVAPLASTQSPAGDGKTELKGLARVIAAMKAESEKK